MEPLLTSDLVGTIISTIGAIVVAIITKKSAVKRVPFPGKSGIYLGWVITGITAAVTFVILSLAYNAFTSEPTCDNLLPVRDELVPITKGPSRLDVITLSAQRVKFDFENGQSDGDYSGIAFLFSPALKVGGFTHLEIEGTSTEAIKFVVEYKVKGGIVAESAFKQFPPTNRQTIRVPLTFGDEVDEIALMFYVKGQASEVTIESICLSK